MEDIHDIKGLVPVPHGLWWLWVLLGLVVLGGIAVWLWKRREPAAATETVAPLSAYKVAVRELQRLREDNPPVEEFYTRLSDIVRRYLEGQFRLRAPERTTEEFLYEVAQDNALAQEHKDLLGAFLQESDLVKFARFRPGAEDMQRAFDAAERFVRDTQPVAGANLGHGGAAEDREEAARVQVT
jgi:hypothetical protein